MPTPPPPPRTVTETLKKTREKEYMYKKNYTMNIQYQISPFQHISHLVSELFPCSTQKFWNSYSLILKLCNIINACVIHVS